MKSMEIARDLENSGYYYKNFGWIGNVHQQTSHDFHFLKDINKLYFTTLIKYNKTF